MQQRKELGHDAFHLVCDKHLVAIELYLVALQVYVAVDAGEIQDTRKVERIVHVQVYPEQRLVLHGIERAVEFLVILVLQRAGRLGPKRFNIVDNVVLISVHLLSAFPFGLLAKGHGHGHELAVLVEQLLYFHLLQVLLAVIGYVEHDV